MKMSKIIILVFAFVTLIENLSAKVKVEKDINYTGTTDGSRQLNIFHSTNAKDLQDVVIFIHGGSWSSGSKDVYWWLGRNLAQKGIVAVNINYRLAPNARYADMATDCAEATKWVAEHIAEYGGNKDRIFLMGHSAGGHLAELINSDPQYFVKAGIKNPIKGIILDDPFGLDMHQYMSTSEKDDNFNNFITTFSSDPKVWTLGSPLHYIQNINNPHLIFYGAKTYPSIQIQSALLNKTLVANHVKTELHIIRNKKHVGMITQMIIGSNPLYNYILDFLKSTRA
jgi:dipeptidyl aminopeptidase/acylaminoacyl peptidase